MSQDINSIIDQLAEIDSASAKIMRKTQDEKKKYAEYINQQKQDYDLTLEKQVDAEIAQYEQVLKKENEKEIAKCKSSCEKDIAKLDSLYEEKGDSLVNEIFSKIIKE